MNISSENLFIGMINSLLSSAILYQQKKQILKEDYHIEMYSGLAKELDLMCN